jgi:Uma2 family endonuclease
VGATASEAATGVTSTTSAALEGTTPSETQDIPMTAQQLMQLPDDGQRYELIKGELSVMTPAGARHGRIVNTITFLLTRHVRQHQLGAVYAAETGFKLEENPDTVRAADAAFVDRQRIPPEGEPEGYWALVPDLVVEVVSPSDPAPAVQSKVIDWLSAGCRLVWIIYPDDRTVSEYRSLRDVRILTSGGTLEGGDVLPGFSCPVSEVFT